MRASICLDLPALFYSKLRHPDCLTLVGTEGVAEGNLGEAERLLARVVEEARALGNPPQLWHALLAYGRVLHGLGRREEAGTAWHEATAVADRLPAEAREGFRSSPLFTAIGELGA